MTHSLIKFQKCKRKLRRSAGYILLDALVAIVVGVLMTSALTELFTQSLRQSTSSSNNMRARQLMQSICELVQLIAGSQNLSAGTYTLFQNGTQTIPSAWLTSGQTVTLLAALSIDPATPNWTSPSGQNIAEDALNSYQNANLVGACTVVSQGSGFYLVTVCVSWNEFGANRSMVTSQIVRSEQGADD